MLILISGETPVGGEPKDSEEFETTTEVEF